MDADGSGKGGKDRRLFRANLLTTLKVCLQVFNFRLFNFPSAGTMSEPKIDYQVETGRCIPLNLPAFLEVFEHERVDRSERSDKAFQLEHGRCNLRSLVGTSNMKGSNTE